MDAMNLNASTFKKMALWINPSLALLGLGFSLLLSFNVQAADFRSIISEKAITYDAPSAASNKLFIMSRGYPVEVIVNLGEWVKVRDQRSGLSWVEGKDLDTKRTVIVTDDTEIKEIEAMDSKLLATVEKDVVLDLIDNRINKGWVKVKHQNGITGYIQSSAIWGLY